MKIVDVDKGHRGMVLVNGREVFYCIRAKLGIRGWVETFVPDGKGGFKMNWNRTGFIRKRTRYSNVDFVSKRGWPESICF